MKPVPLPDVPKGADVRKVAGDHRRALVRANRRLRDSLTWYQSVAHEYRMPGPTP